MKILLLNDNPVVNKLVTLSAQKTSDELEIVTAINEIQASKYDLLVVDDMSYSENLMQELKSKIEYEKSLFICSRDAKEVEGFSSVLKKPFLPTDLVELFAIFAKDISSNTQEENVQDIQEVQEEVPEVEELDDLSSLDGEELSFDDELTFDDDLNLDDSDEISLDDELSLDDDELELGESVLDDEEAQKVKELLEETSQEIPENTLELDDDIEDLVIDKDDAIKTESTMQYDPQLAANDLGLPLDVIEEFVGDFVQQADEYKAEIYKALEEDDFENVKMISHKLKGVAANLKIEDALNALVVVNTSSNTQDIKENLDTFYGVIESLKNSTTSQEYDLALDLEDEADIDISLEDAQNENEPSLDETVDLELEEELEGASLEELEELVDESVTDEIRAQDGDIAYDLALDLEDEADSTLPEMESLDLDEAFVEEETIQEEVQGEELALESEDNTDEELQEQELDSDSLEELEEFVDDAVTQGLEEDVTEETDEDIESQIQEAVESLSEEDLESEIDEETLLEIATNEIDSLDTLSSKDLKLALGEEVEEEPTEIQELVQEVNTTEIEVEPSDESSNETPDGVEALKKLLEALNDKDVAASMKGMKININITLGES
ncbi:Hpt domain-containing protein [Sulfurimonas sp.]